MLLGHPVEENFHPLIRIIDERGLHNPAELLKALAEWMEADAIPATCKHGCLVSSKHPMCPHAQLGITERVGAQLRMDAALLVNLKRIGIREGYGLQEIRSLYR